MQAKKNENRSKKIRICFVTPSTATIGGIYSWFNNIKMKMPSCYETTVIDTSVNNMFNIGKIAKAFNGLIRLQRQKKQEQKLMKLSNKVIKYIKVI